MVITVLILWLLYNASAPTWLIVLGIRVGDVIRLKEWGYDGKYTGRVTERVVTYILRNAPEYGLMPGYCIISIKNKE